MKLCFTMYIICNFITCAVAVSINNNQIFIVKEIILNDALCATFLMKGLLFQNLSTDPDAPCFLSLLGRWMFKESCRFIILRCVYYPPIFRNCKGRKDKTKHLWKQLQTCSESTDSPKPGSAPINTAFNLCVETNHNLNIIIPLNLKLK